jgi:hypothetical protein
MKRTQLKTPDSTLCFLKTKVRYFKVGKACVNAVVYSLRLFSVIRNLGHRPQDPPRSVTGYARFAAGCTRIGASTAIAEAIRAGGG